MVTLQSCIYKGSDTIDVKCSNHLSISVDNLTLHVFCFIQITFSHPLAWAISFQSDV